jgi:protein-L-isoaspartate(D-aspartate) O-methyltransferase
VVVHGDTGLLVPPRDADSLADALVTLLKDEERARRYGAAGYERVQVHVGDGSQGLAARAPFSAIAVAAAAPELPQTLYEQLELRGRLVVPVGRRGVQQLQVIVRSPEGPAVLRSVPFRFVPLLGEEGF